MLIIVNLLAVCFIYSLLLLLSGCEARRLKESESAQTFKSDSDIATIRYAQKFDAKSSKKLPNKIQDIETLSKISSPLKRGCVLFSEGGVSRFLHCIINLYYYLTQNLLDSPLHVAGEGTDCVSMGSCNCKPVGKCKPCSRLDIVSHLT